MPGTAQHHVCVSPPHPTAAPGPWHPRSQPCAQLWLINSLPEYQPDLLVDLDTLTWKLLLFPNRREDVRLHCQLL